MPPTMIVVAEERMPITAPLALRGKELDRYLEIRMLRMLIDPSGHCPVTWNQNGQAVPGQWNLRPHKHEYRRKKRGNLNEKQ